MILQQILAKQPQQEAWSLERLKHERAIALGHALETSTNATYTSQLQSYLSFCKIHHFPIEPTTDTLSFFVVYMSHHISPSSVACYLSGICHALEPYYPNVRAIRSAAIVSRSLAGMKKLRGMQPTRRKHALEHQYLLTAVTTLHDTPEHDDPLFIAMLLTGFYGLLRLGELTVPDAIAKCTSKKLVLRHTLIIEASCYSFTLPFHKADRFYSGNTVMIEALPESPVDPLTHLQRYLISRDHSFPLLPALWLTAAGYPPTYSLFISHLQAILGKDVAGHSLHSGGATALALAGVADNAIQAMGRWSSDTWHIYIWKHPVLLQALLHGGSTFQPYPSSSSSTTLTSLPLSSRV
ncbi:hypothetical protein M422DRAFT_174915 [Sphaerobolus stellatus SS14]|uniref:Uncharacterized protein n=1 Tax=Sphaerobolus stellatus (strain SS14) TaxID=990650 RepID=A0A0C9VND8_SPHS4|nr:hypothetical protein M422DRAFT_174915 [Sphaerobolus stellatus SS14]